MSAMKNHILMLLACILPLLLIFLLPSLGVGTNGMSLLLLLVGCFVVHLLMMRRFGKNNAQDEEGSVKSFTLIIRDVADVPERAFTWNVKP